MTVPQVMFTGEDISLNGIVFNSIDVLPDGSPGCAWLIEDIEGWWEHADLELFDDPRTPYEDGNYYSSGRYNAREITIVGRIIPPPGEVVSGVPQPFIVQARNALNKAVSLVRTIGVLQVNETDAAKIAYVQLADKPLTKFNTISNHLSFSITLRASDPRKFSAELRQVSIPIPTPSSGRLYNRTFPQTYGIAGTGGVEYAVNLGEYQTPAKLRVHGPVNSPAIKHHESGAELRFDLTVGLGEWLDIDLQARSAVLSGESPERAALLPGSKWFQLAPGINTIAYTGVQTIAPQDSSPTLYNLLYNPQLTTDSSVPNTIRGAVISGVAGTDYAIVAQDTSGPGNIRAVQVQKITTGALTVDMGVVSGWYSPVTASTTYNGSIYLKPSLPTSVKLQLRNGGVMVSESAALPLAPGVWTRVDSSLTSAAGQTNASLAVVWADAGTDIYMYMAGAQLTETSTLWSYFSGDSDFSSWGIPGYPSTPNASPSTRVSIPGDYVPLSVVELSYRDAWIY